MRTSTHHKQRRGRGRPFARLLHFGDETWSYKVGRSCVLVRDPAATQTFQVPITEITGMSWDDLERGERKGWWVGIGPQTIKDYISRHLRGDVALPIPPVVYLHPWAAAKVWPWHLRPDCRFLPRKSHGAMFDADETPAPEATKRLGTELTLRNLCGACMRVFVAQRGSP